MRKRWNAAIPILTLLVLAGLAYGAANHSSGPPEAREIDPAKFEQAQLERQRDRAHDPLMVEIDAVLAGQRERLAEIEAAMAATKDPSTILRLQKQMAEVKESTELSLLEIQLEHARNRGDEATVRELESGIQALKTPPAVPTPSARESRELPTAGAPR